MMMMDSDEQHHYHSSPSSGDGSHHSYQRSPPAPMSSSRITTATSRRGRGNNSNNNSSDHGIASITTTNAAATANSPRRSRSSSRSRSGGSAGGSGPDGIMRRRPSGGENGQRSGGLRFFGTVKRAFSIEKYEPAPNVNLDDYHGNGDDDDDNDSNQYHDDEYDDEYADHGDRHHAQRRENPRSSSGSGPRRQSQMQEPLPLPPVSTEARNSCRLIFISVLLLFFAASIMMTVKTKKQKSGGIGAAAAAASAYGSLSESENGAGSNLDDEDTDVEMCYDPIETLRSSAVVEDVVNAAVAADHPECSQMGVDILQTMNGNAIDAAVTIALCLGVANPSSSGIGGGAFILIHSQTPPKEGEETSNADDDNTSQPFIDMRTNKDVTLGEVIDCREVAPSKAFTEMYLRDNSSSSKDRPQPATDASTFGGLAIPVMGELRGLELAHKRYGSLEWSAVVEPVMRLAMKGLEVNPHLDETIKKMATKYKYNNITDYGLRNFLTRGDDWSKPLREKELLQNLKLSELLEDVMKNGADALYTGTRAQQVADEIQAAGGIVTAEDLTNYKPTIRTPLISNDVNGFTIMGVPPPSSGGAAIIGIARFLSHYITPLSAYADTLSVHRISEAMKHAFAIRMSLSDPKFDDDKRTSHNAVVDLTQGNYMEQLRHNTSDTTTLPLSQYGGYKWAQLKDSDAPTTNHTAVDKQEGDRRRLRTSIREDGTWGHSHRRHLARRFGYLEDGGTSHFSVVDKDGNAVAMTTSINTEFGSKVVSASQGFVYSNTMDDFATPGKPNFYGLKPSEANYIKPGKRPLSSMSPTMVFRAKDDNGGDGNVGDLALVIGGSGGPKIITAVVQVLLNKIILGKSLFESVVSPRIHDQLIYHDAAVTTTENSQIDKDKNGPRLIVSDRTKDALLKRNHGLLDIDYTGCVQAVSVDLETKLLTAISDVRKGGTPAGY